MPDTLSALHGKLNNEAIIPVSFDSNVLEILAAKIIDCNNTSLPDLSTTVILLADDSCFSAMRSALIDKAAAAGFPALLGPRISTLGKWIDEHQHSNYRRLSTHECELVLVKAIRSFPGLPGSSQPWLLAENLLALFNELNRNHVSIDEDEKNFVYKLGKAYGIEQPTSSTMIPYLEFEAHLVHKLWHAWNEQLEELNAKDSINTYNDKLQKSIQDSADNNTYWLAGYTQLSALELEWLNHKSANGHASIFIHQPDPGKQQAASKRTRFLEFVYKPGNTSLTERASLATTEFTHSPIKDRISVAQATNEENEACLVESQVRQWLIDGKSNIGIVTQDRRLARRVRAMLDRASVNIDDKAGWALSTTSAAAALERWLECIEQDFDNTALRDLLKSAFVFGDYDRDDYQKTLHRFEQDIIIKENIASGIYRYLSAIDSRETRLRQIWPARIFDNLRNLVATLDEAASALRSFNNNRIHAPVDFIDTLFASMKSIGMHAAFSDDLAGERILHELENLRKASVYQPVKMSWPEIRSWIGRTLEKYTFKPDSTKNTVSLLDLAQSRLHNFDAVIIAAADRRHLPSRPARYAFFNDNVRYALGLGCMSEHVQEQFEDYYSLLGRCSHVLITSHDSSSDGADVLKSKWLEALQNFHTAVFNDDLADNTLLSRHAGIHSAVIRDTRTAIPGKDRQPSVIAPATQVPGSFSASSYQQLIDCPYKFYAARVLRLKASDDVSELLSKAEFGELVHQCLEAMHGDVGHLPGPFTLKWTGDNRDAAITLLNEIADRVFSREIEHNFEHRGWLQRFKGIIPAYVDWQITNAIDWDIAQTEQHIERLDEHTGITLTGRLDRIDQKSGHHFIIDYKTGSTPPRADVLSGEAVQLPFYNLLLNDDVQRVAYLKLDHQGVKLVSPLESSELDELTTDNRERLSQLIKQLGDNASMTAWGSDSVCQYCDMQGLCRRENWAGNA